MALNPKSFYKEGTSLLDAQGAVQALLSGRKKEERRGEKVLAATLFHNILEQVNHTNALDDAATFEDNSVAEEEYLTNRFIERQEYTKGLTDRGAGFHIDGTGENAKIVVTGKDALRNSFITESFSEAQALKQAGGIPNSRGYTKEYETMLRERGEARYENYLNRQGRYDFTKETLSELTAPIKKLRREGKRDILYAGNINPIRRGVGKLFGIGKRTGEEEMEDIVAYTNIFRERKHEIKDIPTWDKETKGSPYKPIQTTQAQAGAVIEFYYNDNFSKEAMKDYKGKAGPEGLITRINDEMKKIAPSYSNNESSDMIFFTAMTRYMNTPTDQMTQSMERKVDTHMDFIKEKLLPLQQFSDKVEQASFLAMERIKANRKILGIPLTSEEEGMFQLDMWAREFRGIQSLGSIIQKDKEELELMKSSPKIAASMLGGALSIEEKEATIADNKMLYKAKQNNIRKIYPQFFGLDDIHSVWFPVYEKYINMFADSNMNKEDFNASWATPIRRVWEELNNQRKAKGDPTIPEPVLDRKTVAAIHAVGTLSLYIKNAEDKNGKNRGLDVDIVSEWIGNKDIYDLGIAWTGDIREDVPSN